MQIKWITFNGNVSNADLEAWCYDNPKGIYGAYAYNTDIGWSLILITNKMASNNYATVYVFGPTMFATLYTTNMPNNWGVRTVSLS